MKDAHGHPLFPGETVRLTEPGGFSIKGEVKSVGYPHLFATKERAVVVDQKGNHYRTDDPAHIVIVDRVCG